MECWELAINRPQEDTFTYRFEEEPIEDFDKDARVYEYSGIRLEVRANSAGKILSVKRCGPMRVSINVDNVINWFVARDDLDYEMPEDVDH